MEELLRTNDLVLISRIEASLKGRGLSVFVADAHASVMDGSLGMVPRRLLVPAGQIPAARATLAEEGLAGELPAPPKAWR